VKPRHRQSGVATLLVVMGLFFIVSMVAAYASRNLIFEQRTSANQYRATQAFEAAEAGLGWALAMLNTGRIDAQCTTGQGNSDNSFRQRYVPDLVNASAAAVNGTPGCQLSTGGVWSCGCPSTGAPGVSNAAATVTQPAYRVRFRDLGIPYAGVFTIESRGCTSPDETCLSQAEVRGSGAGAAALVSIRAAMVPALASRPQAAVTVGQTVSGSSASQAVNTDTISSGITVIHGSASTISGLNPVSAAGSATAVNSIRQDPSLASAAPNNTMFERFFGMPVARFLAQASTVQACPSQPCAPAQVLAAVAANPGRPIWVPGDFSITAPTALGTAADPVLLIVEGEVDIGDSLQLTGILYSRGQASITGGNSLVRGAFLGEQGLALNGLFDVVYDRSSIDRIRNTQGTVVRIPGSWRDF
jgi:Tfp pilus assembly protein PilX